MNNHLVNHIQHGGLVNDDTLYVVSMVSNPVRYQSRYRLAREFTERMNATQGVKLTMVEVAYGDRHHELDAQLKLRTNSEAWCKESAINLGIRKVLVENPTARYVAWIDGDIEFRDPSWALETVQQLQVFDVVQPWSDCTDLGANGNIMQHFKSFGVQHQRRQPKQKHPSQPYQYAHTGFAWAATRRFLEQTQGLFDVAILGSADHHMAFACIGEVADTVHGGMTDAFKRRAREWQDRAMRITQGEVGFVPGRIEHHFHGPKAGRAYRSRWDLLIRNEYDPDLDLMRDEQGLIQLVGKPRLEQDIRLYNRARLEDSIEEY